MNKNEIEKFEDTEKQEVGKEKGLEIRKIEDGKKIIVV